MEKVRVGVVGCGNISGIYLKNMTGLFEVLDVKACTDLVPERAQAAAEEHGIEAVTPEELYADPEIEIILNITIPQAHHTVAMNAVDAGKCNRCCLNGPRRRSGARRQRQGQPDDDPGMAGRRAYPVVQAAG